MIKAADLLREAKIDYIYEGASGGIPDQFGEPRISQCKGLQRRVQVDICGVNEAKRADSSILHGRMAARYQGAA